MTTQTDRRPRLVFVTLAAAALGVAVLASAACNTVKGAGRDLEAASDNVQKAINSDSSKD